MAVHVGIDFGTTNTALALADDEGPVALADLPGLPSEENAKQEATTAKVWRTVLYFDSDATPLAGAPAIARYVQNEGQGRLIGEGGDVGTPVAAREDLDRDDGTALFLIFEEKGIGLNIRAGVVDKARASLPKDSGQIQPRGGHQ